MTCIQQKTQACSDIQIAHLVPVIVDFMTDVLENSCSIMPTRFGEVTVGGGCEAVLKDGDYGEIP